jgi:hypothetical protein
MDTLSRKLTALSIWLLFLDVVTENVKSDKTKSIDKHTTKCKTEDKIKADLLARKELMEKARRELPYTFEGETG